MITFLICFAVLVGAYFIYGRYLERTIGADPDREPPCRSRYDGVDYLPLPKWKTFLIQLLNIAGLGPIFGALLGAMYGPVAFLWITLGGILIGGLHDYVSGMISMKMGGLSLPEIVGRYLGPVMKQSMRAVTLLLMVLVGAVFLVGPAGILQGMTGMNQSTWIWIILLYFATSSLPGWATKNWLPTLFSENLSIDMSEAGPLSTFTIAISSFIGVIAGGILSDKWIQRNVRGRIYTGSIGLALTIPALLLLGFGDSFAMIVGGGLCFGIGFGIFDANNMPILCQFVSPRYRATAYGIMNMTGVFAGAIITKLLGESTDAGNLGHDFAMMASLVFVALVVEVIFLRPRTVNMTDK